MEVEVIGTVKLLEQGGSWLLRREQWKVTPFRHTFNTTKDAHGTYVEVARHFKIAVVIEKDMVVVKARLRGVHFILGECDPASDRHINLSLQSVAKAEVRGDLYFRQPSA
jgi:hypothetical protein